MKAFIVKGTFWMGVADSPFTVETIGVDDKAARERVLSTIGSKHRVDRHHVKITSVKEIARADVTDPVVEKRLSMVK